MSSPSRIARVSRSSRQRRQTIKPGVQAKPEPQEDTIHRKRSRKGSNIKRDGSSPSATESISINDLGFHSLRSLHPKLLIFVPVGDTTPIPFSRSPLLPFSSSDFRVPFAPLIAPQASMFVPVRDKTILRRRQAAITTARVNEELLSTVPSNHQESNPLVRCICGHTRPNHRCHQMSFRVSCRRRLFPSASH